MAITVRLLIPEDIDTALQVIVDAFHNDPISLWLYGNDPSTQEIGRTFLKASLEKTSKTGVVHVAIDDQTDKIVGVSLWEKPAAKNAARPWYSFVSDSQEWLVSTYQYWVHGPPPAKVVKFKAAVLAAREELWVDEKGYWYLHILAISPDSQGKGIGKKLTQEVFKVADKTSTKCFLESSKEVPNISIYKRLGFKFIRNLEVTYEDKTARLYLMERDPVAV